VPIGPVVGWHGGSLSPGAPRQPRALSPVYVGWVQLWPESNENETPDTPTPGVNGHVLSVPALQASMSISSFAPAARTFGWLASTATAGSFCLFWENGPAGLPLNTRVSAVAAAAGNPVLNSKPAAMTTTAALLRIADLHTSLCDLTLAGTNGREGPTIGPLS
jgi:hypothetical protein